jgi:hypothetical protein
MKQIPSWIPQRVSGCIKPPTGYDENRQRLAKCVNAGGIGMLQLNGKNGMTRNDGLTRRDFLRVGGLSAGALGLSLAELGKAPQARAATTTRDVRCILLFLVGGPSHLDTWDPKPAAPTNVRGPFRPIHTNVPGIDLCEHFPLMARAADRYALVRSVHHHEAPIHETGHQLMQTGFLFRGGQEYPHYGSVVSHLRGPTATGLAPFVVLPWPIGYTGVSVSHGQTAGYLGASHAPYVASSAPPEGEPLNPAARQGFDLTRENPDLRSRYGLNTFGQSCLGARLLVEHGVRFVTVNMFDTVFNEITWDCHADGGSLAVGLDDYARTLCPMFDRAYTALLEDLRQRGLLETTLVVAMGEFGRTPKLNHRGGRDHWPGCWTVVFAGAGVRGGQVVGSSDAIGAEPNDRPVTPADIAATVYRGLGIDLGTHLSSPEKGPMPLTEGKPIEELFRG